MSNKPISMIACLLFTLAFACPAQGAEPGKTGNLTEQRLTRLLRGMNRNDANEQLTCVVELEQAVDRATPEDLALLRTRAVPALKAGIHRETRGRMGRPQVATMMQRILSKILNAGIEPDPPTDLAARSQTVARLIGQLRDKDELVKRRALAQIRQLKTLGGPTLPAVKHLAENTKDKLTRQAAQATVKTLTSELWFDPGSATARAAPPSQEVDPQAIRAQLQDLVKRLIERLGKPPDSLRMRALRQLAVMKASGDAAIDKLTKIALDRKETKTIRRAAGMTIRVIIAAKAEAAKWREWQKKKAAEARDKPAGPEPAPR